MKKTIVTLFALIVLLMGLPLAGVSLFGLPVGRYLEFPPRTQFVQHAPFSWSAFVVYGVLIVAVMSPFIIRAVRATRRDDGVERSGRRFPWWGWTGVACGVASWVLAWTRFSWFSTFQPHTFTPLWLSFIVTVNALSYKRKARCMMTHNRAFFLALFPISAAFWWLFEYLNRFVQNWHYAGVNFGAFQYGLFASISFSTVLPAVLGVQELVLTFGWVQRGFVRWVSLPAVRSKTWALGGLIGAGLALFGIGIFPNALFSMLWVAPLLIIISIQILMGEIHVVWGLADGDWREAISAACAALICGWFWEMWNYWSLAKWHYTVPLVDRFHVFEMPILGYAGYLPFGIECAAVGALVCRGLRISPTV
ncbi:MAG: hypothetical protein JRH08_11205 [Deltaproteobacteria bacterium]|nr:hypothetical protein [Deltaproteobacteria bacterium]MBW1929328.1 hypothetical protein [Deltaproteobacteria bacterium]MBW2025142.1 hypothetical protein [Deltaproteobacteria bacterium]MBW2126241.1 hypothetical protein [Deltaproteobacteria bacterium]